jgi:sigma-B regulation protein RsbU (phosphoserine phosphatase)
MTMCYATWQKGRRRVRIANAGQSQPLLWKNGRCEKIRLEGVPLGMLDEMTYSEWATTLDPDDILLFYSDGITEAANQEGEFFGAGRLRDLISQNASLSAAELADLVLDSVESFSTAARAVDDRTLVVVKVKREPVDPLSQNPA